MSNSLSIDELVPAKVGGTPAKIQPTADKFSSVQFIFAISIICIYIYKYPNYKIWNKKKKEAHKETTGLISYELPQNETE